MAIKEVFIVILVVQLVVCATTENKCPSENIGRCRCFERVDNMLSLQCHGTHAKIFEYSIEEYSKLLQKTLSGITKIKLTFYLFTKESRLTSKVFDGLPIRELEIQKSNVIRWADAEGGPAFVGLEDTLEKLVIGSSYFDRKKTSDEYVPSSAQFTLSHLRKLREVTFYRNDINTLPNDWFENGPDSLEILDIEYCGIEEIGDHAFAKLPNLKEIRVHANKVERLTRSMFPNPANHLKELNFNSNQLSYLSDDFFINMPALIRVDFNANQLRHLPETTWRPVWSRLDSLSTGIVGPDMKCNDFAWIFDVRPPREVSLGCYDDQNVLRHFDEIMREKQGKGI